MSLRVGLLGGGSWGTTVASLVARNVPITLWARDKATVDEINSQHSNGKYLPDVILTKALRATDDLEEAVSNADVLIMGVPSQGFRSVLGDVKPYLRAWVPIISLTKGLELDTRMRMTQVINDVLPGHPSGVLSGPNLAREVMSGRASASVIAMEDKIIVRELQPIFRTGLFRVYTNDDVTGCELGGVLKNIMAIGVGMGDGQGAGDNTRAALLTRGLAEITRLGVALGGRVETFAGLAGMGDMIATCTSPQSRNRHVGLELGKGRPLDDIVNEMFMVAEGVKSAPAVMALAEQHGVEMPIAVEVFRVVTGQQTPRDAFRGLLKSTARAESDPG